MAEIIDIRDLMADSEVEDMARKKSENPKIEFMRQYLEAEKRIPMKMERIARMKQKLLGGAQVLTGMPGGGSKAGMGDSVISILAMIERTEADIERLRRYHDMVLAAIDALPDGDLRAVMEARYLNGWNWGRIAKIVPCDPSTAWRLHGRALTMIALPEDWNENRAAG